MKILIAEDSLTQRLMLEAISRKAGFEPLLAEDGQQALDILLSEDTPGLVLLDWEMPRIDGLEVCKRVRNKIRDNPPYIILLTSRSNTEDIVSGLDSGASDYVKKPYDSAELLARLNVGKRMLELQHQLLNTQETLAFQASHDELTGLLNRRTLLEIFKRELSRALRQKQELFVGICDLDHFKSINDTYGHLAGDVVLQESSKRMLGVLRNFDVIARYGGEEFIILLSCDSNQAQNIFERLRNSITEKEFKLENAAITVTGSFGVTRFSPDEKRKMDALLAEADKALYHAKNTGRNRVVYYESIKSSIS